MMTTLDIRPGPRLVVVTTPRTCAVCGHPIRGEGIRITERMYVHVPCTSAVGGPRGT